MTSTPFYEFSHSWLGSFMYAGGWVIVSYRCGLFCEMLNDLDTSFPWARNLPTLLSCDHMLHSGGLQQQVHNGATAERIQWNFGPCALAGRTVWAWVSWLNHDFAWQCLAITLVSVTAKMSACWLELPWGSKSGTFEEFLHGVLIYHDLLRIAIFCCTSQPTMHVS